MSRYFLITAVDNTGKKVRKTLRAEDERLVLAFLDFMQLTPVKIWKFPGLIGKILSFIQYRKITRKDLIDLFNNMHLLIRAGVPLGLGLWELAQDVEKPAIRDMLHDIAFRIYVGESLSSAMERYEDIVGSLAVNIIKLGEQTGNLEGVLKDIAEHYAKIEDFYAKVKQALLYPAFTIIAITGALIFWLVYVLPKITELFETLQLELPAITRFVMAVSYFMKENFFIIIAIPIILFFLVIILRRTNETFRFYTDKLLLKIPIINVVITYFNLAFFSEYLRLMIVAGISIMEALDIIEKAIHNRVYSRAVAQMKRLISDGESISESMKATGVFPNLMVRMIAIGESSGALDEQLEYLARHYYEKLDYITQNIAKMIEPIVIMIVGGFMATIMISLLLPIYDLIAKIANF